MNYNEALKILNLYDGFTEEDLKKAYRTLAKKYHPDINSNNENLGMMKKINEAHDILEQHLKQHIKKNPSNNYASNQDIVLRKIYREKMLKLRIDQNIINTYPRYLITYLENINNEINNFLITSTYINGNNLENSYIKTMDNIKFLYLQIKKRYFDENWIIEDEVNDYINFDCRFSFFFKQLENINFKYGRKQILQNILDNEIAKYKSYPEYFILKNIIEEYKNKYFIKKLINFDISIIIKDFTKKINELFIECNELFKNIKLVLNFIVENENNHKVEVQELIKDIKNTFIQYGITSTNILNFNFKNRNNMTNLKILISDYLFRINLLKNPPKNDFKQNIIKNIDNNNYFIKNNYEMNLKARKISRIK